MSMCEAISDRMPAVAAGRSEWNLEEGAHLASCPECQTEWRLVQAASDMGRDLAVDTAQVTRRVLQRVRTAHVEEQRNRFVKRAAVLGALAVAATMLFAVLPGRNQETPWQRAQLAAAPAGDLQLAELDDAAPAELEVLLAEFDGPAVPASSLDGPDLEGMDQSQVERALRSWEES